LLSEAQLYAWGWRIPFAVGALLALVVFWIRRGIDETRSFELESADAAPRRPATTQANPLLLASVRASRGKSPPPAISPIRGPIRPPFS